MTCRYFPFCDSLVLSQPASISTRIGLMAWLGAQRLSFTYHQTTKSLAQVKTHFHHFHRFHFPFHFPACHLPVKCSQGLPEFPATYVNSFLSWTKATHTWNIMKQCKACCLVFLRSKTDKQVIASARNTPHWACALLPSTIPSARWTLTPKMMIFSSQVAQADRCL